MDTETTVTLKDRPTDRVGIFEGKDRNWKLLGHRSYNRRAKSLFGIRRSRGPGRNNVRGVGSVEEEGGGGHDDPSGLVKSFRLGHNG